MSWIFTSFDCCIQWNIVGFAIITQLDLPGFLLLITLLQLTTHNSGFSSMRNQLTNPFHFSERVRAQSHAGVNHGLVTKCEDYHWPTLGKTPCELGTQDPSFQGPEQLYFVHKAQIHSCEGFSLPMVACSKSREFSIVTSGLVCKFFISFLPTFFDRTRNHQLEVLPKGFQILGIVPWNTYDYWWQGVSFLWCGL